MYMRSEIVITFFLKNKGNSDITNVNLEESSLEIEENLCEEWGLFP